MMATTKQKLRRVSFAVVAILVIPGMTWAAWRPDSWITAKTKIALLTSAEVSAIDVNVDTVDSRVTLHGMVPSETAKQSAEKITEGIDGVREVRNLLQVVPKSKEDTIAVEDEAIKDAITRALAADEITKDSDIEVQSVNDGVVLLGGEADSLLQHLEAIRIADRTKGVRRVATEVSSSDELYDEKLWHDPNRDLEDQAEDVGEPVQQHAEAASERAAAAAKDTGEAIQGASKKAWDGTKEASEEALEGAKDLSKNAWEGTKDAAESTKDAVAAAGDEVRDGAVAAGEAGSETASDATGVVKDAWITTAVKTRLLANTEVPGLAINVDTDDGVVTLFGIVPTQSAKEEAETEVRQVSGVKEVRNKLDVSSEHASSETGVNDEIVADVREALKERSEFDDSTIHVSEEQGVVHLEGRVPDHSLVMAASTVAHSIDGVRSVRNDLRVGSTANMPGELTR